MRLPSGSWYAQQVDKEQRWLPVLAPQLPLPIPDAGGQGRARLRGSHTPGRSTAGSTARSRRRARIGDLNGFASTLAEFLRALGRIDATGGPEPGEHNFFRGGPLATYADETQQAIETLGAEVPGDAAKRLWEDAMATSWDRDPVWFHGDVAVGNLLVREGRLAAVLDFGSSGVGDPACDTVIAWTFLSGSSRDRFRAALDVDAGTWSRGRGWALWKALISLVEHLENDSPDAALARRDIDELLRPRAAG